MTPNNKRSGLLRLVFTFLFLIVLTPPPPPLFALTAEQAGIPKPLQEWIPWVTHNQEERTCTLQSDNVSARYCAWPTRLLFEVAEKGASFRQEWFIETKSLVLLPGGEKLWPTSVKDAGRDIAVIEHEGSPAVWLDRGAHVLTGTYSWNQSPESIDIPKESGLVTLKRNGTSIDNPDLDSEGKLWLKAHGEEQSSQMDQATLQVFRKIQDKIPLVEEVNIRMTVSGAPREICLGMIIKDDFLPLQIRSPLPVRMDQDGRLCIQVRPGQWQIGMTLRSTAQAPLEKLGIGTISGLWPDSEVWVFEAAPDFRQVAVENVQSVDPSQTGLPREWITLPAYLIGHEDTMVLTEKSRGIVKTNPDNLTLARTLWLDEKGTGLTTQDSINGTMTDGWRLNTVPQQHLGKATVAGVNQLITKLPDSDLVGIEVRKGSISLSADSRIEQPVQGGVLIFPALGWSHSFQELSAQLNLPPGWKLLTATGIDKVSTWLNRWTLLDIFLVLIISLASGRILGWGWGMLALVTLGLMYHQPASPQHLWLPLLALLAIGRKIVSAKGRVLIRIALCIVLVLLLFQSVPFMIREVRVGLFPQLDTATNFQVTNAGNMREYPADEILSDAREEQRPSMAPAPGAAPTHLRSKMRSLKAEASSAAKNTLEQQSNSQLQIDPQARVQTGPGLPNWRWQTIPLTWNGPVDPSQKIRLVLLSPKVNCFLSFLRVVLLTLMLLVFVHRSSHFLPSDKARGKIFGRSLFGLLLPLLILLGASHSSSAADIPPASMLNEMQERLFQPPACGDACASIDAGLMTIEGDAFRMDLTVHVYADSAVSLPGDSTTFSQILVDNIPATAIRSDGDKLLVRIPQGIHHVTFIKNVKDLNEFNLTFPLSPHHMQAAKKGWDITGIHPDGTLERQIALIRQDQKDTRQQVPAETASGEVKIPAFFQIDRTLHMGLKWTVETRITRKSSGNIITAEIPLLPGEMPTSESLYITDKKVQINLGPQDDSFSWQSALPVGQSITLTAARTSQWTESWNLDISSIWHATTSGMPEVSQLDPAGLRFPQFRPYPGESLTVSVSRPEAVPGPTMTIDASQLTLKPGLRATDFSLQFSLIASQGARHTITLPPDSDLQSVLINGAVSSLHLNGRQLTLPIQPGSQQITVNWQSRSGVTTMLHTPPVDLGLDNVNSTLHVDVPISRWILMTGGPRVGPAVLFWGEFLVMVLLAFLLGRTRMTPLSTLSWLLLGIGLSQVSVVLGALVVGWLFLLAIRKKSGEALSSATTFNLLQMTIVVVTLLACLALLFTVKQGLLGHPDMQIDGNGSYNHSLNWYQDRNAQILPQAWVLTVPLLSYRILMLFWALWLAFALLKWLSWGWDCFGTGGIWKKIEPKAVFQETIPLTEDREEAEQTAPELREQGGIPDPQPWEEGPKKSWFRRFSKKGREKT